MKKKSVLIIFITVIFITACTDLDLNPLSEGSSQNWYSNQTEVEMAVNDLFRSVFWNEVSDEHTDNYTRREALTLLPQEP
jgi:starch-binding outer membrane protein, SusD/RagB family